ncbi:hypothetical protein F7Q99_36365 [Streptomyces kaniharaensis]|uniref:DNA primase/polymerase bifunctional N-terminal domain-containing protein n=1 Tax=Streptomyces kaniharaensis TaxID=212423 RepID=A0A6N7L3X3_9ACTN|nr:hypothetical protein [Streptomyces kaniharaensis]MQS17517.1 hypothetical protein [Streptomyces kaniharaensis]
MHPTTQLLQTPAPFTAAGNTRTMGPRPIPSSGARWLLQGQDTRACITAWQSPHGLAPIHPGAPRHWDAISVQTQLGEQALHLLADRTTPGPVLLTGTSLVFWVPPLHHDWNVLLTGISSAGVDWGRDLTAHHGPASSPLMCPQPGIPRDTGVRWLVAPDGGQFLTPTGQLADILHSAYRTAVEQGPQPAEQDIPRTRTTRRPTNLAAHFRRHSTTEPS